MDKFGRNFRLTIAPIGVSPVIITLPFTIEFDILRRTLSGAANVCQLRIYNLSQQNRNLLRFNLSNYGQYWPVIFEAGYGNDLGVLFKGNVSQGWSTREGVNFITQVECYDGGFAFNNGVVDLSFAEGTSERVMITQAINQGLPNVSVGAIGGFNDVLQGRGNSYSGNTVKFLSEITGGAFFIDNEKAYVLKSNEVVQNPGLPLVISAATGLLGTPSLEYSIARFEILFEPKLEIGRQVEIRSETESNFNGFYKTTAVQHRGMISDAVCGSVITTGEFFFDKLLVPVAGQ